MPMIQTGERPDRCPSCGTESLVYIEHRFNDATKIGDDHIYCTNCDYGVCGLCGLPPDFPVARSDKHEHQWEDLSELDGKQRSYMAVICLLCGETQVD